MLILAGCTLGENTDKIEGTAWDESTAQKESTVQEADSVPTTEDSSYSPLQDFIQMIPDAEIHDTLEYDLDGNGETDYIILYSSQELSCNCGLSVCLANSMYSGIDLDSDQLFQFASGAELDFIDGVPVISVELENPENKTHYLYTIEYSVDKSNKFVNYAIASEIMD